MERSSERQELLSRMYEAHTQSVPGMVFSKVFLVVIPVIQISMGVVYRNECPQQTYIPKYLIVSGVFGLLPALFSCLSCANENEDRGCLLLSYFCSVWNSLASLFFFCWLIAGSVWTYSIYPPNYNKTKNGEFYCNKTLYLSAFWTTTLVYILIAGLLLGSCCVLICVRGTPKNTQRDAA